MQVIHMSDDELVAHVSSSLPQTYTEAVETLIVVTSRLVNALDEIDKMTQGLHVKERAHGADS